MNPPNRFISILLVLILLVASRWFYMSGSTFVIDGDESIMGLMARHFLEGKELPLFFYGQSYGFAFIEVLFISGVYSLIGVSGIALKVAMLILFAIGLTFFYLTLYELNEKRNSWLIIIVTALLALAPSWAIWAMKARGGYHTAFAFSFLTTFLLFNNSINRKAITSVFIGLLIVLIYQSQPLWLVGLLPLVAFQYLNKTNWKPGINVLFGLGIGYIGFVILKSGMSSFWSPSVISWDRLLDFNLMAFVAQVYKALTGSYYYGAFIEPDLSTKIVAWTYLVTVFLSVFWIAVEIVRKRKSADKLSIFLFASVILSISYFTVVNPNTLRYLLPLQGFLLLLIFFGLRKVRYKGVVISALTVILVISGLSIYNFRDFAYSEKSKITDVVETAQVKDVKYVFCEGGLLQWQLIFYSNESIIARYRGMRDRYQPYIDTVNAAFFRSDPGVGLVGYMPPKLDTARYDVTVINDDFFLVKSPSRELLEKGGFKLE
jgi:hypothetical protein